MRHGKAQDMPRIEKLFTFYLVGFAIEGVEMDEKIVFFLLL